MVNELLQILCRQPILGYNKRLANWISKYRNELNIRVTKVTWPQKYNLKCYDYLVEIKNSGLTCFGRGFSYLSADTAISIAFAECIERSIALSKSGRSTNGIATHFIEYLAQINAYEELLERDAFFCHYLTSSKFYKANIDSLKSKLPSFFYCCNNNNLEVYVGHMKVADRNKVGSIVCIKNNSTNKIHIGASVKSNQTKSLESAFLEAFRNAIAISENKENNITKNVSYLKETPESHRDFYSVPGVLEKSNFLTLFESQEKLPENFLKCNFRTKFNKLHSDVKSISESPFITTSASSMELQNAFWGETTESKVNINRMSSFLGRKTSFSDLNLYPHPFD